MKRIVLIILMGLVLGNFASADIYIKEVVRTNTYVDGKLISSKQTAVNGLWIGDKKITYNSAQDPYRGSGRETDLHCQ